MGKIVICCLLVVLLAETGCVVRVKQRAYPAPPAQTPRRM
jgi:hypothetical protein